MVDRYGSLCGNDDYQEMAEADDGAWVKYSDYEALEAKLAALEQAAQRLVDHAKNSKQELWASLPDVINLRDVLEGKEE